MTTRSNILRLALVGLLLARAPRWVQRMLAYMALGVAIAVILIVLGVAARAGPQETWLCGGKYRLQRSVDSADNPTEQWLVVDLPIKEKEFNLRWPLGGKPSVNGKACKVERPR